MSSVFRLKSARSTLGRTKLKVALFKLVSGEDIVGLIEASGLSFPDVLILKYPARLYTGFDMTTGASLARLDNLFMSDDISVALKRQHIVNVDPVEPTDAIVRGYWEWLRMTHQARALEQFDKGVESILKRSGYESRYHRDIPPFVH